MMARQRLAGFVRPSAASTSAKNQKHNGRRGQSRYNNNWHNSHFLISLSMRAILFLPSMVASMVVAIRP